LNRSHLNENSKSQAVEDGRSNVRDNTTEAVKEGIINVIDTAQAIGENTKDAGDMVWESVKEGADTVKDKIKDNGNARSSEDIEVAGESGIEEEWKRQSGWWWLVNIMWDCFFEVLLSVFALV
jgi:hypothetical protein